MTVDYNLYENEQFESDVRRIASTLWPEAAHSGSEKIDGRERDGIFETRDTIYVIEATTSRKRDKIVEDAKKTDQLVKKYRNEGRKVCQGYLITKEDPTADQREAHKPYRATTTLLSFAEFRSLIFNGSEYIDRRTNYPFGSARDEAKKTIFLPTASYIPVDYLNEDRTATISNHEISKIASDPTKECFLAILGEYGSGKSTSLRAIWDSMRKQYAARRTFRCPLYLNLREHTGQKLPVEALERHAREITYKGEPSEIARAWRAGFTDIILDGFDEMATAGWGGSLKQVRAHRKAGMLLVRNFLSQSPPGTKILIAGRDNFFDSLAELRDSLGLGTRFRIIRTSDFSEENLKLFLERNEIYASYPNWLPARPLLVSYLVYMNLLPGANNREMVSPAEGWDLLLDMIASREAGQDDRLEAVPVRRILETLATIARRTVDGLGNFDILEVQEVFRNVMGFPPDEAAQQFLLRLPGLGATSKEDSSRSFVDRALAEALQSGDPLRFIETPYEPQPALSNVAAALGEIGKDMVAERCRKQGTKIGKIMNAARVASESSDLHQTALDLARVVISSNAGLLADSLKISDASCEKLDFTAGTETPNFSFHDCVISRIEIEAQNVNYLPKFTNCLIGTLTGLSTKSDVPNSFMSCEIMELQDEATTNADILNGNLPEGVKVLLTILRKLFMQDGAGRQQNALSRGAMSPRERLLVPEVLSEVRGHDFAHSTKMRGTTIWLPNRKLQSRARAILAAPHTSTDPIIVAVREL